MENTRSYVSRFSGLGLFIVALLVVGVLVWLTVQSADDNGQDPAAGGTQDEQTTGADEPAPPPEGEDESEADEETAGSVAGEGTEEVASNGDLPNTGPESVLLPAVALGSVVWIASSYRRSVQELEQSQR